MQHSMARSPRLGQALSRYQRDILLLAVTENDGFLLDIRYATADNLTGAPIYSRPVALLRPEAHALLRAAAARAALLGLQIKVFDAFRPVEAQWALWRALPDARFVSDPVADRGLHPRGVAVDLTLVDRASGLELDMGTGFDDMTSRSAQDYLDLPPVVIRNRALLLGTMAAVGWDHIASEWWHFQVPGLGDLPSLRAADQPDGPM
jgi:zinc D-Ala-D-Ala dipeptidase